MPVGRDHPLDDVREAIPPVAAVGTGGRSTVRREVQDPPPRIDDPIDDDHFREACASFRTATFEASLPVPRWSGSRRRQAGVLTLLAPSQRATSPPCFASSANRLAVCRDRCPSERDPPVGPDLLRAKIRAQPARWPRGVGLHPGPDRATRPPLASSTCFAALWLRRSSHTSSARHTEPLEIAAEAPSPSGRTRQWSARCTQTGIERQTWACVPVAAALFHSAGDPGWRFSWTAKLGAPKLRPVCRSRCVPPGSRVERRSAELRSAPGPRRPLPRRAPVHESSAGPSPRDCRCKSMPDCSPTKCPRPHELVLRGVRPGARHRGYFAVRSALPVFSSTRINEAVGERHERPQRGVLSAPTLDEISRIRAHVDGHMLAALEAMRPDDPPWHDGAGAAHDSATRARPHRHQTRVLAERAAARLPSARARAPPPA